MVIFHSYVSLPESNEQRLINDLPASSPFTERGTSPTPRRRSLTRLRMVCPQWCQGLLDTCRVRGGNSCLIQCFFPSVFADVMSWSWYVHIPLREHWGDDWEVQLGWEGFRDIIYLLRLHCSFIAGYVLFVAKVQSRTPALTVLGGWNLQFFLLYCHHLSRWWLFVFLLDTDTPIVGITCETQMEKTYLWRFHGGFFIPQTAIYTVEKGPSEPTQCCRKHLAVLMSWFHHIVCNWPCPWTYFLVQNRFWGSIFFVPGGLYKETFRISESLSTAQPMQGSFNLSTNVTRMEEESLCLLQFCCCAVRITS
jgi:hypothetical protein